MDHMNTTLTKTCTKCGEEKEVTEFHKCSKVKSGYRSCCKKCRKMYQTLSKEKIKQYGKGYREKRRDTILKKKREYYENNKDTLLERQKEYYEYNKQLIRATRKKYVENNRAKVNHNAKLYKLRKRNAAPSWLSGPQLAHIKRTYKLREIVSEVTGMTYHVDHIVPLQGENVCGLHVPWNLVVIPAIDNISKSNTYDDWLDYH